MSKNQSENVEVILTLSPEHYHMIERCAKIEEKSVEQWILQATEGSLRSTSYELENTRINLGFGDDEVNSVVNQLYREAAHV